MIRPDQHQAPPRRLLELAFRLEAVCILRCANPPITSITADSRTAEPGSLFVAIDGHLADGHDYIDAAVEAGAAAVVCERPPAPLPACPVIRVRDSRRALSALADALACCPSRRLRVVGITGTDGKTSTAAILRAIMQQAGGAAGSIGTLGYIYDDKRLDSELTTPGPARLHAALRRMLLAGVRDVCMEVSSHSLVQHRVADVAFDGAILTNITHDHLDAHGTRKNYARAKRMLFEMLPPGAVAALPADCEFTDEFEEATRAEVLTYSAGPLADVKGRIVRLGTEGMTIEVATPDGTYGVRTPLVGDFNCENILAAATMAFGLGVPPRAVIGALEDFPGVPGRLERVEVGRRNLPAVYVDYAHTPEALEKVLRTLRGLVQKRLVCVVGCGGDRDRAKRPLMGDIAARGADVAVFTADNSRSEKTEDIIEQMVEGVSSPNATFRVEPDRRSAIRRGIELAAGPGSLAVICGRGCEKFQKMGGERIPFDDRVVAGELMREMPMQKRATA